ncbi:hypothetical protein EST38_g4566 [Candolleomyces aberdarensis]|uniref:Uncharacterized protein n=1 Tax=Candolleomyces aberdarensis TaxID=2316362 RepID=A0A4Q2DQ22_9AGAR|nr:hypothetical protein EST38_g4566 [Candolleomyces aberdarensis]
MGPRSMSNTNQDDSFYDGGDPRPTLHRRKSAKMLIDQYETMHDGTTGRPPDLRSPSRSTRTAYRRPSPSNALLSSSNALRHRSTPATTFNATASASFYPSSSNANKKDSSTAPLKHSFKNLFSLLKKGKNGLMGPSERDKVIFPIAAAAANKKSAALAEEHKELPLLPIPLGDAQRPALSRSQTQMGALIYLTRYTPAGLDLSDDDKYPLSGIPLWAECTITLEGRKIAVSWSTPEGIPCARDIALVGCSDIRSVSPDLRSLEPEERKALPGVDEAGGGGESLKVFELLFKDRRPPERFAVASVKTTADGLPSTASSIASSPGSKANLKGPDSDWSPDGLQQKRVLDGIASIRSVLGQREAGSGDGMTIQQVTLGLDHRLKGANETLKEVKSTLHVIEKRLEKAQKQGPSPGSGPSSERHEEMLLLLKAVKAQLAANLPGLEMKISEIGAQQEKILAGHQRVPASESLLDLGPIQRQLDDLIKLTSSTQAVMKAGVLNKDVHSEITRLISLMEGDRAHREQQLLQQADSVRYLNELNTWLEAFVNNGASHIQSLATSIDKLCADLGPVTTLNDCAGSSSLNLLNDVRQLVLGMKARDQNMASLQAALNDLIVAIGSETRHGAGTTTLARLMETQKRNQESMLKAFTDEISDEIKGERLRFVEAMKEATAINVQRKQRPDSNDASTD